MHKLRKNYAKITQKKLRKNYAYVCKLHNLDYYAPHTLLMKLQDFCVNFSFTLMRKNA